MTWSRHITAAYTARPGALPRFAPRATDALLAHAERTLGRSLPADLRALLAESDGVMELVEVGGARVETGWVVFPTEVLMAENSAEARDGLDLPDTWLSFGSAGADGIVFGYDSADPDERVWAWHPMERRHERVAASLAEFLHGWITGAVAV